MFAVHPTFLQTNIQSCPRPVSTCDTHAKQIFVYFPGKIQTPRENRRANVCHSSKCKKASRNLYEFVQRWNTKTKLLYNYKMQSIPFLRRRVDHVAASRALASLGFSKTRAHNTRERNHTAMVHVKYSPNVPIFSRLSKGEIHDEMSHLCTKYAPLLISRYFLPKKFMKRRNLLPDGSRTR